MTDAVMAWHFVGATLRDGRSVPADGDWLIHDGPLVLCETGLHASLDSWDALRYAPGPVLCRVELAGAMLYARIAGAYGWRTRLSEARVQLGMTIENRQRKDGRRTVSEYRYVPARVEQLEMFR